MTKKSFKSMNVEIISKPAFTVCGIEGRGTAEKGPEWVPPLWTAFRSKIDEIQDRIIGDCWGLMSAVDEPFGRWKTEGRYLAGIEVLPGTSAPKGWTNWILPFSTFATIPCTMESYNQVWEYFHQHFLPNSEFVEAGAVHEFYPSDFQDISTDSFYLYFTIKKKN